jgi:hypothetical protein
MQPGRAYDFDGSTDYIDLGSALNIGGENTIAFWIKTADTNWATFGNSGSNYFILFLTDTFYFRGGTGGGPATCAATIADEWTHLAVARTGSTIKFYINAVEQTVSGTVASGADSTFRYLGFSGVGAFLDGTHFDCRAYDSVLTLSEIQELYTLAADALPNKSTVLHLKCDDTHSTIAYDSSGNGNDGTKTGTIAASFHLESANVPWSWQNDKGYSDTLVPRDESAKTLDVLGASLDYTGKCPRNAQLIQSHCATLDKTNDFVDCGDLSASVKSIAFWIKPDSVTATTDYVIDLNGTDYITIVNGTVTINGFAAATTATYVDGAAASTVTVAWHHVVITSDTGFSASDCDIGRLEGTGFLGGSIAGVRLFSDELTAAEALSEYNREGTTLDNQIAYWPMAEGAGDTHYDVSGNGNSGTITGYVEADYWQTVTQDVFHWNSAKGFSVRQNKYAASATTTGNTENNVTLTVSAGPFGASGLRIVPSNETSTTHRIISSSTTAVSGDFVVVYFKKVGTAHCNMGVAFTGGGQVTVDDATNAAEYESDGELLDCRSIGDGWKRAVMRFDQLSSSTIQLAALADGVNSADSNWVPSNTADGLDVFIAIVDDPLSEPVPTTGTGVATARKVPALDDGSSDAVASNIFRPSGTYHNGSEPAIDLTAGVAFPQLGDALATYWTFPSETLSNVAFSGAESGTPGTAPTDWSFVLSDGTLTVTGTSLNFATTTARHIIKQVAPLLAESLYELNFTATAVSGVSQLNSLALYTNLPAGASVAWKIDGVAADATDSISGTQVVTMTVTTATTAGSTFEIRLGMGCSSSVTGSADITGPTFNRVYTNPNYARRILFDGLGLYRVDRILHYSETLSAARDSAAQTFVTGITL